MHFKSRAWGVLKSKKMILQHAIKNNFKRILLLQDDLFFIEDFHKKFEDFIQEIAEDWKLVQLGASQFKWKIPEHLSYRVPLIAEYDPREILSSTHIGWRFCTGLIIPSSN